MSPATTIGVWPDPTAAGFQPTRRDRAQPAQGLRGRAEQPDGCAGTNPRCRWSGGALERLELAAECPAGRALTPETTIPHIFHISRSHKGWNWQKKRLSMSYFCRFCSSFGKLEPFLIVGNPSAILVPIQYGEISLNIGTILVTHPRLPPHQGGRMSQSKY